MTSTSGKLRRGPTDIMEFYNWTRLSILRQKGKRTAKFVRRVKKLCRSKSNGGNLISLINAWGVGLVHYSAGIADRTVEELVSLDSKLGLTDTSLDTSNDARMYLLRREGADVLVLRSM